MMSSEYQELIIRAENAMKIFDAIELSWNGTHYTSIVVRGKLVPVTEKYIDKCVTAYTRIMQKIKLLEEWTNEEHRENT